MKALILLSVALSLSSCDSDSSNAPRPTIYPNTQAGRRQMMADTFKTDDIAFITADGRLSPGYTCIVRSPDGAVWYCAFGADGYGSATLKTRDRLVSPWRLPEPPGPLAVAPVGSPVETPIP